MSRDSRLDRLEDRLQPGGSRTVFHHCTEHDDLSWEEHVELHRQRGQVLFTLDFGAANIRDDA
jgi:hypothetical protein